MCVCDATKQKTMLPLAAAFSFSIKILLIVVRLFFDFKYPTSVYPAGHKQILVNVERRKLCRDSVMQRLFLATFCTRTVYPLVVALLQNSFSSFCHFFVVIFSPHN